MHAGHTSSFKGTLTSPQGHRGGAASTPTSLAGPGSGPGHWDDEAGAEGEHEHGRNFDIYSDRQEMAKQLKLFEERMRSLHYSEQRIQVGSMHGHGVGSMGWVR